MKRQLEASPVYMKIQPKYRMLLLLLLPVLLLLLLLLILLPQQNSIIKGRRLLFRGCSKGTKRTKLKRQAFAANTPFPPLNISDAPLLPLVGECAKN